jgi:hypothetical protein
VHKFHRTCRLLLTFFTISLFSSASWSAPLDDIRALKPFWVANAPLCNGAPSSADCSDGDMTLFSGLLCASGEALGCRAVQTAQDASGRWHRSPRFAAHPELRINSFSWDMALGVQLYAVTTRDVASLNRWLAWVERSRPCLVQSPALNGTTYCLVRGWPRWCTDDDEKGCTAKPQQLATLVRTARQLGAQIPDPAEDVPPDGLAGAVLRRLQDESRQANTTLSLKRLMEQAEGLQPFVLLADAILNKPGYSRHLVGVEILLARRLGLDSDEIVLAAKTMALKEKTNPFFRALDEGASPEVLKLVLSMAPRDQNSLPVARADWAWQRENPRQVAKAESNLWDFIFIGNFLGKLSK